MKKEKKVRTYQRRTKSGKLVTVKAHTAKYDAAERVKELAKKKGAGDELEERKKKKSMKSDVPFDKDEKELLDDVKEVVEKTPKKSKKDSAEKTSKKTKAKETKSTTSEPAFTAAEFKEWYQGTGSAADKKVAKALRAQLGRSGYKKLEDEAIDNYTPRGHLSMFKRVNAPTTDTATKSPSKKEAKPTETSTSPIGAKAVDSKLARKVMKDEDFSSVKEAKAYLAGMSRKEYDVYVKSHAKESAKRSALSTIEGVRGQLSQKKSLIGSSAETAKKTLMDSGFVAVRIPELSKSGYKIGTQTGLIGPNGVAYVYRGSSFDIPAVLFKANKEDTSAIKAKATPKKPQAKSVKKSTKRMTPKETAEFIQKSDWIYGGE